jgi:hypothetical protein
MIVRQARNTRTVVAPSYHLDLATDRLTILVPNATLLDLVPGTIRRAVMGTWSERALTIVIDCRRSPSPPGLSEIRLLAEALADAWDVNGPIALVAQGIDTAVLTFELGKVLSARAGNMIRVFSDVAPMERFMQQSALPA